MAQGIESPPGEKPKKRQSVVTCFEEDFRAARAAMTKWRSLSKAYYKAYAGDPWKPGDKTRLEETDRPPANINLSLGTINAVLGSDMGDRKEVRFEGVDTDLYDATVAEWMTNLTRHQFMKCNGHRIDSHVLFDGLITGYGYSETYLDTQRFPFRLATRSILPFTMYPDPEATEDNLQDARFLIRESDWRGEEVKARWGNKLGSLTDSVDSMGIEGSAQHPRTVEASNYAKTSSDLAPIDGSSKVKIYTYQYATPEPWVAFTGEDGNDTQVSLEEFKKQQQAEMIPADVQFVQFPKRIYRRAFLAGAKNKNDQSVLLEDKPLPLDRFTTSCYTGLRYVDMPKGQVRFFGLMHVIFEPQRWSAKIYSMLIEMLARGSKGGVWVESDAFDDPEQAKEDYAKPAPMILVESGALGEGKIKERDPMQWPAAMAQILTIAQEAIPNTSGVTNWLKGTATTERSNVLISNLQQQSLTMLNPVLDPMSSYRMNQGTVIAQLALKYLSSKTINKIIGEVEVPGITHEMNPATGGVMTDPETQEPVPVMNEQTGQPITPADILKSANLFEFDVQVDTGQASPTARQAFWRMWVDTALLQNLLDAGVPIQTILPKLIEYSPLPTEMSKTLANQLEIDLQGGSLERVVQMLTELGPEEHEQVFQALQQLMTEQGGGQQEPAVM